MEQPLKTQIERLKKNLKRINKLNNANLQESVERGKTLEGIKKLVDGCKNQIPEGLWTRLDGILQEYVERCTDVKRKLKNKGE